MLACISSHFLSRLESNSWIIWNFQVSTHPTNTVLLSGLDALTTEDAVNKWWLFHWLQPIILNYFRCSIHWDLWQSYHWSRSEWQGTLSLQCPEEFATSRWTASSMQCFFTINSLPTPQPLKERLLRLVLLFYAIFWLNWQSLAIPGGLSQAARTRVGPNSNSEQRCSEQCARSGSVD